MRPPSQTRWSTICYVLSCTVFVATVYLPQIADARAILWFAGHETENMDEWWAPEKAGVEHENCGGEYTSNGSTSGVSTIVAHRGRFSPCLNGDIALFSARGRGSGEPGHQDAVPLMYYSLILS
jgi:hypothetical protein